MSRAWLAAVAAALLGACSSGSGGCDSGSRGSSSGESTAFSGGSSRGGGPSEAVSFVKTKFGLNGGSSSAGTSRSSSTALGAPAALGKPTAAASAPAAQSVLCGGFPDLPDDCLASPRRDDIKAKCCPDGIILACRAIPGGARLTGRGCSAPPGP